MGDEGYRFLIKQRCFIEAQQPLTALQFRTLNRPGFNDPLGHVYRGAPDKDHLARRIVAERCGEKASLRLGHYGP